MSDYEHMRNYIDDGYICDSLIWMMRDKIDPPMEGYVMWSSSGWEENVEHLVEHMGIAESDIVLVRYGGDDYGHTSCWIPREHSPYESDRAEEEE